MKAIYLNWIVTTLFVSFTTSVIAQNERSTYRHSSDLYMDKYLDRLDEGEKVKKGWYHYVGTKTKNKKYLIRIFYPDTGQLVALEEYKSDKYLKRKGTAKYWYENGQLKSEGSYKKNEKSGQWKFYSYENGSLSSVGMYKSGSKVGQWTYYENGQKSSVYTFVEDIREGPFINYDTLGAIRNQGTYKNDMLYSQITIPTSIDSSKVIQHPLFDNLECNDIIEYQERKICADRKMLEYIYLSISYPVMARDHYIQGDVMVHFTVNKLGTIEDLTFEQALCDEIKEECTRVILGMPKWIPGTKGGIPTNTKYSLPLKFAVEYDY